MSAYSSSFSITSRGAGQSAVAHGAYIMRARLLDERDGLTKDYTKDSRALVSTGILTPENAPAWAQDVSTLLNTIEAGEKRKDSQLTRNLLLALPHELTAERRAELVTEALGFWVERGAIVAYAIHHPDRDGDDRNHHAHVMMTMRELDGDSFAAKKNREWNRDELATAWRDHWAERGAEYLRRDGFAIEADRYREGHLDLPAQREKALERGDLEWAEACNREPTQKVGATATAMERRGAKSDRGAINRAIIEDNERRVIDLAAEREKRRARDAAKNRANDNPPAPGQAAREVTQRQERDAMPEAAAATIAPRDLDTAGGDVAPATAPREQQPAVTPGLEGAAARTLESEPEQAPQPAPAAAADQPAPIVPAPPRTVAIAQGIKMAWDTFMHRAQHELESFAGFLGDFFIGSPGGLGSSEPTYKEPEPQRAPEPDKTQEAAAATERHNAAVLQQEQHHAQELAQAEAHEQQQRSNLERAQELLREQQRYLERDRDIDRDR